MSRIPPKPGGTLFHRQPGLTAPASYICVIRDPETKAYRIEATLHPKTLVDNILREADRKYGVELITILATDDLAASEAHLYKRHGATLGSDWLHFDQYRITKFNRSLLMVKAYRSHYVMSESPQSSSPYTKCQCQPVFVGLSPPQPRIGLGRGYRTSEQ